MESIFKNYELQIDEKPSGVVIRLNDDTGKCVLRICRVPKILVYSGEEIKEFIDITYPAKENLKTFEQFINESNAEQTFGVLGSKEQQKQDINADRKTPQSEKDKKFQDKTKKQALTRTAELQKSATDIKTTQQKADQRLEDIKKKQAYLRPDDPNAAKNFDNDQKSDLKGVEGELDNAKNQRELIQKQADRLKKKF